MHVANHARRPLTTATAAGALAAVAAVTGCAPDGGSSGDPPELPDNGETVVIQLDTRGTGPPGPRYLQLRLSGVPEVTAYADGRVVVVVERTGQLARLQRATVDRSDLAALLAEADSAGLLADEGIDTGEPAFSHPSVTTLTLADATATHELAVFDPGQEGLLDLTADQRRLRQAVADLGQQLTSLAEDGAEPYRPDGLAVYVLAGSFEAETEPTVWPLERTLAEGGQPVSAGDGWRCLRVTGDDAVAAVAAAARTADGPTWSSAGREWTLAVRPLLPHEHACPST